MTFSCAHKFDCKYAFMKNNATLKLGIADDLTFSLEKSI